MLDRSARLLLVSWLVPPSRFVPMLQKPKHRPPRFLPSLSSGFVVFTRRLVWLKLVVSSLLGTAFTCTNIPPEFTPCLSGRREILEVVNWQIAFYSDGIARVHGMSNVQAEELVEYCSHLIPYKCVPLIGEKVRLGCQGHVHELGSRSGWCRAFRLWPSCQGRWDS